MNTKAKILSVAVLIPLHIARAAMRVSVSLLSERDRLHSRLTPEPEFSLHPTAVTEHH